MLAAARKCETPSLRHALFVPARCASVIVGACVQLLVVLSVLTLWGYQYLFTQLFSEAWDGTTFRGGGMPATTASACFDLINAVLFSLA